MQGAKFTNLAHIPLKPLHIMKLLSWTRVTRNLRKRLIRWYYEKKSMVVCFIEIFLSVLHRNKSKNQTQLVLKFSCM